MAETDEAAWEHEKQMEALLTTPEMLVELNVMDSAGYILPLRQAEVAESRIRLGDMIGAGALSLAGHCGFDLDEPDE